MRLALDRGPRPPFAGPCPPPGRHRSALVRHLPRSTPTRLQPAPIAGRLLVVAVQRKGYRSQTLYLFTSLTDPVDYPVAALVELYGLRWHIELNLRYLKTQMRLVQLDCKSAEMARRKNGWPV